MREIVVGDVFTWSDRPVLEVKNTPGVTVRNGVVVVGRKPRRWWHLVSWYRLARLMWRRLP